MFKQLFYEVNNKKEEIVFRNPFVTIVDSKIQIENYKKIYKLTSEEIVILFNSTFNDMIIEGKNLKLILASAYMLIITGKITDIRYPKRR